MDKSHPKRTSGRNQSALGGVRPHVAKEPKNWAWVAAFALSVSLHVLVGGREPAEAAEPSVTPQDETNLEVLWLENAPEPDQARELPEVAEPQDLIAAPEPRATRLRRTRDVEEAPDDGNLSPASAAAPSAGEASAAAGDRDDAATTPALDVSRLQPAAVAMGTFGPRLPTPRDETAAMEAALEADLYRIANAAAYDTVRPAPQLRETGDGGYTYSGHLFVARISPSGEVSFDDEPNFGFGGLGGPSGTLGVGFTFDISAAAERAAGNDPNSAERRWFMEETRSVRERLAGQDRARTQGRGLVRLRRQLHAIWDSDRPAVSRREAIFRLWDSCEEDEVGAEARAAIVEFIQEHLGVDGSDAFAAEELRRLNTRRASQEAFAPYHVVYE